MPAGRYLYNELYGTPVNPGTFRHQITIQRKAVSAQNSYGEDTVTWADVVTMKARVQSLSGRELETVRQFWADARAVVTIHRYDGIQREDRLRWYDHAGTERLLNILDIQDGPGTDRYLRIIAKDYVA